MHASCRSRWLGAVLTLFACPLATPAAGCGGDVTIGEQDQDAAGGSDGSRSDAGAPRADGSGGDSSMGSSGGDDTGTGGGDDTGTGGGDDASVVETGPDSCADNIFCTSGSHWSPQLCTCVPDDAGPDGCGIPLPCPAGAYFDPQLCMCVYLRDGGPCVSPRGGPCGGFTSNPCQCMPGLTCVYEAGIADLPGTCQ